MAVVVADGDGDDSGSGGAGAAAGGSGKEEARWAPGWALRASPERVEGPKSASLSAESSRRYTPRASERRPREFRPKDLNRSIESSGIARRCLAAFVRLFGFSRK
ncbi:PREDICTED: uncharacterized protein LOC106748208 isoform X2 [Dinoponera quadriceps]|uniref:Uncharacterized protein LOC106748208 isoform X2 n=1 Tax=Dinoponera quadriceps TaxID=609295 RepID=A0A6P3XVR4_DINQU|nr:PREDICTED: uncharacterized protein LOC106748208 isoform X2 [Dinoponera quadriceps]